MTNLLAISEWPFQITGVLCLFATALFVLRLIVAFILPIKMLPSV